MYVVWLAVLPIWETSVSNFVPATDYSKGSFNYSPSNFWESRVRLFYCCPQRGRLGGMPQNIGFLRDKAVLPKLR